MSVVCYRLQSRRPRRGWTSDSGSGVDFSSNSGGGSSWSLGDRFSSSSTDGSGNPTDSGWDSSSGGDSGGAEIAAAEVMEAVAAAINAVRLRKPGRRM